MSTLATGDEQLLCLIELCLQHNSGATVWVQVPPIVLSWQLLVYRTLSFRLSVEFAVPRRRAVPNAVHEIFAVREILTPYQLQWISW